VNGHRCSKKGCRKGCCVEKGGKGRFSEMAKNAEILKVKCKTETVRNIWCRIAIKKFNIFGIKKTILDFCGLFTLKYTL
jgi:hypothetical protein